MSFGNAGGGSRTGRKYVEQITVGLTPEDFAYLRRLQKQSLAEALRQCIARCKQEDIK